MLVDEMGGGVMFEELPYTYAYRSYPVVERWVPVYSSSLPTRGSNDLGYYYDDWAFEGNNVPIFFVQTPFMGEENLARKQKLDRLKGESISARPQNIGDILLRNGGKATPTLPSSNPIKKSAGDSKEATLMKTSPKVDAPALKYPNVESIDKVSSQPRIISIPVISTDDDKDNSVNCSVVREEGIKKARKITEDVAAVLVQSCIRGHLVRRTEPLTQLRSIARVRSQLMELKEKASDVDFIEFARENSKARVKLTESLMNLLLQLDAIQGAHPSVREIRKALAKDVVAVQERVDALLSSSTAVVDLPQQATDVDEYFLVNEDGLNEETSRAINETEMLGSESDRTELMALDDERIEPNGNSTENGAAHKHDGLNEETSRAIDDTEMLANESDRTEFMAVDDERDERYGKNVENVAIDGSSGVQSLEIRVPKAGGMETSSSGADGMQTIEDERLHTPESHSDQPRSTRDEAGEKSKQLSEGIGSKHVEVATAEADAARMNLEGTQAMESQATHILPVAEVEERSSYERVRDAEWDLPIVIQSGNGSEEDGLCEEDAAVHRNKVVARAMLLDETNMEKDEKSITQELAVEGRDQPIHVLGVKPDSPPNDSTSCPVSPRSPFEMVEKFDSPASTSDSEHQSDIEKASARHQDASAAQGNVDNGALVLKLSEENKALKSLLLDVMKWNQLQATVMHDVNHRLGKLESKLTHRIDKRTKKQLRRGEMKSRQMLL